MVRYWCECELGQLLLITTWQYLHKLLKQKPFSAAIMPSRKYPTHVRAHASAACYEMFVLCQSHRSRQRLLVCVLTRTSLMCELST